MGLFYWSETQIFTAFFVFLRVSGVLMLLPLLGDKVVPPSVKVLFSIALSVVVFPVLWKSGVTLKPGTMDSTYSIVIAGATEMFIGLMIGFLARCVFDAVQSAGYFMGTSMGFSMGSMLDPQTETQIISIAEFQYALAALLFLAMDGHHVYVQAILDSFHGIPLGDVAFADRGASVIHALIDWTSQVLVLATHLSAPVLVVMFLVNMAFGLVSRAVPQINILVVSFAANILVGLLIVIVSLPAFQSVVASQFDAQPERLRALIHLLGK